ncbi:MAG: vWA domain-containing protein [Solirubrobacteraceae bacterium]
MAALLVLALATQASAAVPRSAGERPGSAILIMDSSGSMRADSGDGRSKIAVAKQALERLAEVIPAQAPTGLEVYGARVSNTDRRRGCRDVQVVLPVGRHSPAEVKARVRAYRARGFTPIGRALESAAKALPPGGERTIVLVSDGIDTCAPPPPCTVARRLAKRGVKLKIETVGFQVDGRARRQLQCIARVSGGVYRDANDADSLAEELRATFTRALRLYLAQGRPISGGPTSGQAVRVTPGQYVDTFTPGRERWYAIPVAVGQNVVAAATLVPRGALPHVPYNTPLVGQLLDPSDDLADFGMDQLSNLNSRKPVAVGVMARPSGRPGQQVYRVRVYADRASELVGRRIPLELFFDTPGQAQPEPRHRAPAPAPAGGAGGGRQVRGSGGGSAGASPLVAVLVALGLAALGFLATRVALAARRHGASAA